MERFDWSANIDGNISIAYDAFLSTLEKVLQKATVQKWSQNEPCPSSFSENINKRKYAATNLKFQYRCLKDELTFASMSKKKNLSKLNLSAETFVEKCKEEEKLLLQLEEYLAAVLKETPSDSTKKDSQHLATISKKDMSKEVKKQVKEERKQAKKALKSTVETKSEAKVTTLNVTAYNCLNVDLKKEIAARVNNLLSYDIIEIRPVDKVSSMVSISCPSKRIAMRMTSDLQWKNSASPVSFACVFGSDKESETQKPITCTSVKGQSIKQLEGLYNVPVQTIDNPSLLKPSAKEKIRVPPKTTSNQSRNEIQARKNELKHSPRNSGTAVNEEDTDTSDVTIVYMRQNTAEKPIDQEGEKNKRRDSVKIKRQNEQRSTSSAGKSNTYVPVLHREKGNETRYAKGGDKKKSTLSLAKSENQSKKFRKKISLYLMKRMFTGKEAQFCSLVRSVLPPSVTAELKDVMIVSAGETTEAYLTAVFESKQAALRTMHNLKNKDKISKTRLICSLQPFSSLTPEAIEKKRLELITSTVQSIAYRAQEIQMGIELKIEANQINILEIDTALDNEKSEHQIEKLNQEKQAFVDGLDLLLTQKSEFQKFIGELHERLNKSKEEPKFEQICLSTKKDLGVECLRIENPLPVYSKRSEILSMVEKNQVSIILAETGSGKSTQVVQYLREYKQRPKGLIVCTQPRKIAAISVATRVAQELGTNVGNVIGYKVGLHEKHNATTEVLFMTDHALLLECLEDKDFKKFSHIIIDEAHERSVFTDVLLGILKKCLAERPDLRVIITSATIDPKTFCDFFDNKAAVMRIGGRMFPVELMWSLDSGRKDPFDDYQRKAVKKAIDVHRTEPAGDILVFLTSALEIERSCAEFKAKIQGCIVLPLHGSLQQQEQQKVFEPAPNGIRKVIFSTNIAETSVTIPGIKYVIDTGVVKEMKFNYKKQMNILAVAPISKSSAKQRKGRAGRTCNGKCFRLYPEDIYDSMEDINIPEILRIHLSHVMIKLLELDVNPLEFDYVVSPSKEAIEGAIDCLEELGAVEQGKLTELGKKIGSINIEPNMGSFVFECLDMKVGIESIVIAAANSSGQIFFRAGSDDEKLMSDKKKVPFCNMKGDIFTMLHVFREWHKQPEHLKGQWCKNNSINGKSMKSIRETANEIIHNLKKQLKICTKYEFSNDDNFEDTLMWPLLKTFRRNIGHFLGHSKAGYLRCDTLQRVNIHPSSALFSLAFEPRWMFYQSTMQTTKDFALNVTAIPRQMIIDAVKMKLINIDVDYIEAQALTMLFEKQVGCETMKEFVGFKYQKLRQMEENLMASTRVFTIIDANKTTGLINVWSDTAIQKSLLREIENNISIIKQNFRSEVLEQPVAKSTTRDPGVRVSIGNGPVITNVFMPNEYKSVLVHVNEKQIDQYSKENVSEFFNQFGNIQEIKKFYYKKNNPSLWGIVTFQITDDAVKAVDHCRKNKCEISARPTVKVDKVQLNGYTVKVQWCRRPSKGVAFVDFKDVEDALRMLRHQSLEVGGKVAMITTCRFKEKESPVRFLNLNRSVTEDVLRERIFSVIGEREDKIERITILREDVRTTPVMLGVFKRKLQREIEIHAPSKRFHIQMIEPREKEIRYTSYVTFNNPEEGEQCCREMDHTFAIGSEVVTMIPNLNCSFSIFPDVYSMIEKEIENFRKEYENNTTSLRWKQKQLRNGFEMIDFTTDTIDLLAEVKRGLQDIVEGDITPFNDPESYKIIFSFHGRQEIKRIMDSTRTLIIPDHRKKTISLYGETDNKSRAKIKINSYLQRFLSQTSKFILLKGNGIPPGALKKVMGIYGINLEKLSTKHHLMEASINIRNHSLLLIGEKDSVQKAVEEVDRVVKQLPESIQREHDTIECVACLTPVEDLDTLYRLEDCGHAYDIECLKLFLQSSMESKSFPMLCASEGCRGLLLVRDLNILQKMGLLDIISLVESTLGAFVAKHKEEYHYCITADCPVVYRVSKDGEMFACPECNIRVCTHCHVQYHAGITCGMYKSSGRVDDSLQRWMKMDGRSRKICPSCGTPIEKRSGCNKMMCVACQKIFCWLCGKVYDTDRECYGHLEKVHGGFGNDY